MKAISFGAAMLLCASGLMAATAETIPFLTLLQAGNEVPAINDTSSGNVIVWLHLVRDNAGAITSGSVDFDISTRFSGAVTVVGLHIHTGAAGVNGGIVVPTDVNATDKSIAIDAAGRANIVKQVQFPASNVTLATIQGIIDNPQNFYVNIHTTANPGGAMRGQLMRAEMKVLMGLMSTANEVPPTTPGPSGLGTVTLLRALNPAGQVGLATAIFRVDYTGFSNPTTFTGLHIHNGTAGNNGGVIINTGITANNSVAADASGTGSLNYTVPMSPLDNNFAAEAGTVNSLFTDPSQQYINLHSTVFGGGVIRDQMRNTEKATFQVDMLPSNEVPPIAGLPANAQTAIPVYLLRNADGTIAAGTVIFDVNYRGFPAGTTFIGLHIHQAAAGSNGGIVIGTDVNNNTNRVVTDTGNGNIFKFVTLSSTAGVTALNNLVQNPAGFYSNLHTTVNTGGAVRSQLAPAAAGRPSVGGTAAASSTITSAAPGSIISIYGTDLAAYTSDLGGFYKPTELVTSLNGVSVTIGGVRAPFYFVSPGQLNVQVPFEVSAGTQPVVVTTPAGASTASNLTVASVAPSIFIIDQGASLGAIVKNSDFSLITGSNPVRAGDTIVIYSTGLGQTTPAARTGTLLVPPTGGFNNTGTVTATIGGVNAPVVYSIASPGFAGLYQTAVTVPSGVTGSARVVLSSGSTASNAVSIMVQ